MFTNFIGSALSKLGLTQPPTLTDETKPSNTIEDYQEIIKSQIKEINDIKRRDRKITTLIGGIGLSIGLLLGPINSTIIRDNPTDNYSLEISSKVAKLLGAKNTISDYIEDGAKKDKIILAQKEIIEGHNNLLASINEQSRINNQLLAQRVDDMEKNLASISEALRLSQNPKINEVSQAKPSNSKNDNLKISQKVIDFVKTINESRNGPYEIKYLTNTDGTLFVWVEGNGKKSIGYNANSKKYTKRLSFDAINNWANKMGQELDFIEQIYSLANDKKIPQHPGKNDIFSINVKQSYTGTISIKITDNSSKKSISFTARNNTLEYISGKIDSTVSDLIG